MKYFLDADICSYAMKGHEAVIAELGRIHPASVALSAITESELRFGAAKKPSRFKAVDTFLSRFEIASFTSASAREYARVRAHLEKSGAPIGSLDMLLAAHAVSLGVVLVTNNEREFRRVPGLEIANWAT